MHERLVVANLKMQWRGVEDAKTYLRAFAKYQEPTEAKVRMVLCGPYPFLERMRMSAPSSVAIGAQDVFWDDAGAYTGNVSAPMIKSCGVEYVVVGHSERRIYNEETDADVMQKLRAAVRSGLIPILCVGETGEERAAGQTDAVLERQIELLTEVDWVKQQVVPVIAYEPRWAIGGNQSLDQEGIITVTGNIRSRVVRIFGPRAHEVKILYGGSVTRDTVRAVSVEAGLDGVLVGRSSFDPVVLMGLAEALEA